MLRASFLGSNRAVWVLAIAVGLFAVAYFGWPLGNEEIHAAESDVEVYRFLSSETNKWGFRTPERIIIPPIYDEARDFSDNCAAVRIAQDWFYISLNGDRQFEATFVEARSFSGGYAEVRDRGGWHFVNVRGIPVFAKSRYSEVRRYSEPYFLHRGTQGWSYQINPEVARKQIYESYKPEIGPFEDAEPGTGSILPVKTKEEWRFTWALRDQKSIPTVLETLGEQGYVGARAFYGRIAAIQLASGWTYLEIRNSTIARLDASFTYAFDFDPSTQSALALRSKTGESYELYEVGYVDSENGRKLQPQLLKASDLVKVALESEPQGAAVFVIPTRTFLNNEQRYSDINELRSYRVPGGNTPCSVDVDERRWTVVFYLDMAEEYIEDGVKKVKTTTKRERRDINVIPNGSTTVKAVFGK